MANVSSVPSPDVVKWVIYMIYMIGIPVLCVSIKYIGFHSISSPGRGNMYLTTKSVSPFCGENLSFMELSSFLFNNINYLGYHYLIEVTLDHNIAKTSGEIFVAIHSNYEMLANVSVTSKYVRSSSNCRMSPFFLEDPTRISKLVMSSDICSVTKLI